MAASASADEVPTRSDPVVATLSEVVGGPLGPHAGHHPWWSPQRVLLGATAVVLAAGMTSKASCTSSWSGDTAPYAHLCWSELAGASASQGAPPWPADVLTRLAERVAAPLPGAGGTLATVVVLAVAFAALALVATLVLTRADRQRPWAGAGWAAAPLLAVHWLSWDLVAAVGVALALWAWLRRDSGAPALAAMGLGGFLLVAFAHPLVTAAEPDTGSVWLVVEQAAGSAPDRAVRLLLLGALVAVVAAVAQVVVRRRGGTGAVATARVVLVPAAVVLLLASSAPPEASLLVLPLAAVAAIGWRDLLVWQGCELVSWAITGWYLAGLLAPSDGGDARVYWVAVVIRTAGLLWLAAAALRARST